MKKIFIFIILAVLYINFPSILNASKIRVMTFNIRQDNIKDGPLNLWKDRCVPLCKYMNKIKPDIFGMQEVFKNQLDDINARMKGYQWVGAGREDGHEKGEYSPIFFKTSKYRLISKGTFWLSETPDVPSVSWNAKYPRIATWVILEEIKTKKRFFYCNSHFDHKSESAKNESAKFIKKQFKKYCQGLPIIFTADCNTYEPQNTYFTILNHNYPLVDTYKSAKKVIGGPSTSHSYGKNENIMEHKIDFIFTESSFVAKQTRVDDSSIGDGRYLSDHHPMWSDLVW